MKVAANHATKRIADCELSVRTLDSLKNAGLKVLGEVSAMTDKELLALPYFGRKSLNEIRQCLREHGDPEALRRLTLEEGAERIGIQIYNLQVSLAVIQLQLARDHSDRLMWQAAADQLAELIDWEGKA